MDFHVELEELLEMAWLCGSRDVELRWPLGGGSFNAHYLHNHRATTDRWLGAHAQSMIDMVQQRLAEHAHHMGALDSRSVDFAMRVPFSSGGSTYRCKLTPNAYGQRSLSLRSIIPANSEASPGLSRWDLILGPSTPATTRAPSLAFDDRHGWIIMRRDAKALESIPHGRTDKGRASL